MIDNLKGQDARKKSILLFNCAVPFRTDSPDPAQTRPTTYFSTSRNITYLCMSVIRVLERESPMTPHIQLRSWRMERKQGPPYCTKLGHPLSKGRLGYML